MMMLDISCGLFLFGQYKVLPDFRWFSKFLSGSEKIMSTSANDTFHRLKYRYTTLLMLFV
jgi:hypothetical protein